MRQGWEGRQNQHELQQFESRLKLQARTILNSNSQPTPDVINLGGINIDA